MSATKMHAVMAEPAVPTTAFPVVRQATSAVPLSSDASDDEYMVPEVRTPVSRAVTQVFTTQDTPASPTVAPQQRAAPARHARSAAPKASVLDLSGHQNLRRVDGATLSHNDAVRIVRLPACLETIADDFARGCPRLHTVDLSRCTQLRRIGDRFFAESGAPVVSPLTIDLTPCAQLRSIGADFAAGSRVSLAVLPASVVCVGANFVASPQGPTPLVDLSRCTREVVATITAQPAVAGRRIVRVAPQAPSATTVATAPSTALVTAGEQALINAAALLFNFLVWLFRTLFGTSF